MTAQRWARVKEIFGATFEQPEGERAAILDLACGEDTGLRDEVERLLAANQEPSWQSPAAAFLPVAAELAPGDRVGQYRIDARLGEGGMGVVYRAIDTRLQRAVALKVVRPEYLADPELAQRTLRQSGMDCERAAASWQHRRRCHMGQAQQNSALLTLLARVGFADNLESPTKKNE